MISEKTKPASPDMDALIPLKHAVVFLSGLSALQWSTKNETPKQENKKVLKEPMCAETGRARRADLTQPRTERVLGREVYEE